MRMVVALVLIAGLVGPAAACASSDATMSSPRVVLEVAGAKSDPVDLVVMDLAGKELFRQPTGSAEPLSSLHVASAQVAFWRGSGAPYELVVWNIASKGLKVIESSSLRPAVGPLWSNDGTELVSLRTTAPISYAQGVPLAGTAEISITTVSTASSRTLASDRPFIPLFADGTVVAGTSLAGDRTYVVVDAHSGRTTHVLDTTAWAAVQPTPDRDVVIAFRESATPGAYALYALDVRTGAQLSQISGPQFIGPMPAWPGRNEIAIVADGELKAFDYKTSSMRVVGSLGDSSAFGFDSLGQTLLVVRSREPSYGTVSVRDGRLTSAVTNIVPDPSPAGRPLGLVRLKS